MDMTTNSEMRTPAGQQQADSRPKAQTTDPVARTDPSAHRLTASSPPDCGRKRMNRLPPPISRKNQPKL
jgi:hypothetical protein